MSNHPTIPPSIYFSGCAYASIAYVGVYKAMIEKWGPDFMEKTKIAGDSAGVIFVLGITRKFTPEKIGQFYHKTCLDAPGGMFHGGMHSLTQNTLLKLLDNLHDDDLYKSLNDKIYIGTSTWFANHIWSTRWRNNDELFSCMKNTLHIPLIVPRHNGCKINGCELVDGAFCFSGKDLPDGDDTLYVGDDPSCEVSIPMSLRQMVYPVIGKDDYDFHAMIDAGYNAFMQWDGNMKKKVGVRRPKYVIQAILWILKSIELLNDAFKQLCQPFVALLHL